MAIGKVPYRGTYRKALLIKLKRLFAFFSLEGPLNNTCTASTVASNVTHVWASTLCPLENECANGRNNCDPITQLCVDTPEAYRCVCKQGYDDTAEPG